MKENYTNLIESSVRELFRCMESRVSAGDMARIRDAYELARDAHREQRRKSGEPYIIHPIAVARIVAEELELGADPVIAALLHDVVEDTSYTIEEIRSRFGEEVAFLVGVVTKRKKTRYEHSKQVDNYQQILASVQYDIRAILIKLADRLHNMRTLESMRADKQMKIAGETDYFYAPLANRLGLYHIKSELENLSFHYRCPREYQTIASRLDEEQRARRGMIGSFLEEINDVLERHGLHVRTELRCRTPYSIWRKMQSAGCDFNHADGKHYIRIIYDPAKAEGESLQDFDLVGPSTSVHRKVHRQEKRLAVRIYAVLTDYFKERPGSVANYIDAPKENGYQSFHVKLLSEQGTWEEIHISSERMVRNSRLGCTAEWTEENVSSWLEKFKGVLQDVAAHDHEMDYMDGVTSSFYNDDIMAFTPQGKGVILPKGATALDFAYEIHSEVGEHAVYARINGKLASVKTVLRRGDCVEIGTDPSAQPEVEWLDHVLTYKAKRCLRYYLATRPQLGYDRCPHCHPLPGDEVVGFQGADGGITLHKRVCPTAIRLASQEGDSIVAVDFAENPAFLYPVRICIRGVDRYHLLSDLVDCITEKQRLSMTRLETETVDRIAVCTIDFPIRSVAELQAAMESIAAIEGIDEVRRVNIE